VIAQLVNMALIFKAYIKAKKKGGKKKK